jgi:polar amino acid transport system permease protein
MQYHLDWSVLLAYRGLLLDGLLATTQLSVIGCVLSLAIGVTVALARAFLPRRVSWIFVAYIEAVRNVPPIVQFFLWYFGVGLDIVPAAIIGLSVFHGAYMAELVRSGINAVPRTQWEAARSSGMTAVQTALHIVLPQALIRIVPLFSNQFVGVLKDSSIAMTIGFAELTLQTQEIESQTFRGFEAATAVTVLYVALAVVIVLAMHLAERAVRLDLRRG